MLFASPMCEKWCITSHGPTFHFPRGEQSWGRFMLTGLAISSFPSTALTDFAIQPHIVFFFFFNFFLIYYL